MGARRGASAERIAEELLRERGFHVEETHHIIGEEDAEGGGVQKMAEIDFLATRNGVAYAVEVKAGSGDVQAIRQAYANAHLVGRAPLLVCKSLANEARLAAERLGVEVLEISHFYPLIEPEELEILIRGALEETLERYGFLAPVESVTERDRRILEALAASASVAQAADRLGMDVPDVGGLLAELKRARILPARSLPFEDVARAAAAVLARLGLEARLSGMERSLARIERALGIEGETEGFVPAADEKDPTSLGEPPPPRLKR